MQQGEDGAFDCVFLFFRQWILWDLRIRRQWRIYQWSSIGPVVIFHTRWSTVSCCEFVVEYTFAWWTKPYVVILFRHCIRHALFMPAARALVAAEQAPRLTAAGTHVEVSVVGRLFDVLAVHGVDVCIAIGRRGRRRW